jgi:spermidine synthase
VKPSDETLIHETLSTMQEIRVFETDELRLLRSDDQYIQSALSRQQPHRLVLPYMKTMCAGGLLFQAPPQKVLLLGLGGGDLMRYLHHYLPNTSLTAVEQDAHMVKVARDYFALPAETTVEIADAGLYMRHPGEQTDWLLIDLFCHQRMPATLLEPEFYDRCRARLSSNGVLVMNFVSADADLFKLTLRTIRSQFDGATLCMTVPDYLNVIILAFKQHPTSRHREALTAKADPLTRQFELDFRDYIENVFTTNPTVDGELSC